jgi:hypothetical protein
MYFVTHVKNHTLSDVLYLLCFAFIVLFLSFVHSFLTFFRFFFITFSPFSLLSSRLISFSFSSLYLSSLLHFLYYYYYYYYYYYFLSPAFLLLSSFLLSFFVSFLLYFLPCFFSVYFYRFIFLSSFHCSSVHPFHFPVAQFTASGNRGESHVSDRKTEHTERIGSVWSGFIVIIRSARQTGNA